MTNNTKCFIGPDIDITIKLKKEYPILEEDMRPDKKLLFCGSNFIRDLENIKNNNKYD